MEQQAAKRWPKIYKNHITEQIMPFWDARCIDETCGGYLTCFDRKAA